MQQEMPAPAAAPVAPSRPTPTAMMGLSMPQGQPGQAPQAAPQAAPQDAQSRMMRQAQGTGVGVSSMLSRAGNTFEGLGSGPPSPMDPSMQLSLPQGQGAPPARQSPMAAIGQTVPAAPTGPTAPAATGAVSDLKNPWTGGTAKAGPVNWNAPSRQDAANQPSQALKDKWNAQYAAKQQRLSGEQAPTPAAAPAPTPTPTPTQTQTAPTTPPRPAQAQAAPKPGGRPVNWNAPGMQGASNQPSAALKAKWNAQYAAKQQRGKPQQQPGRLSDASLLNPGKPTGATRPPLAGPGQTAMNKLRPNPLA